MQGKTIVITGAASGIGRVWAERFFEEGAQVLAADINEAGLATLRQRGIRTIVTDVGDADSVAAMIAEAIAETGRLDVLFNNAGIGYGKTIEDSPQGMFEKHIAIHLFGCVNGMRCAIPQMKQQNYGRIINTISRVAEVGSPTTAGYAAGKAAIWAATRVAASELKDFDVLVNMLIPGPTNTAIWGVPRPNLQSPEVTYPTARMLATFPAGGPSGKVYWDEKEYPMFNASNR